MTPDLYARLQRLLGTLEGIAISLKGGPVDQIGDMIMDVCEELDGIIDEIAKTGKEEATR